MKKTFLISLIITSLLMAAVPMTALAKTEIVNNYSDILGNWYTDAVTAYGYTDLFSDGSGKFYPDKKITRIEFAQLLYKALGISINYFVAPDVHDDFDDVQNTDIGAGALIDLATTGIIERGGNFNPTKQLERDLMIHWIMNALNYQTGGFYPIPKIKTVPYKDDKDITEAYRNDLYTAQLLRLIFGRGDNTFFPNDGATRAEGVTMAMRLMTFLSSLKTDLDVTASAWLVNDGSLVMSLSLQNNKNTSITINHTSGQKFDFKLFDTDGNNLYTWSADKSFILLINTTELLPGESVVYTDTLDSAAFAAINGAVTLKAFIVGTSSDFAIDTNGYSSAIVK